MSRKRIDWFRYWIMWQHAKARYDGLFLLASIVVRLLLFAAICALWFAAGYAKGRGW